MARLGDVTVKIDLGLGEVSPQLRELLRQLIREELAHLDPNVADQLANQVAGRMVRAARTRIGPVRD